MNWRLWGIVAVTLTLTGCGLMESDDSCPDKPLDGEGWSLSFHMEREIEAGIKRELFFPDTYEEYRTLANMNITEERDDGSEYLTMIKIEFSSENIAGVNAPGTAWVTIEEQNDGVCRVEALEVYER